MSAPHPRPSPDDGGFSLAEQSVVVSLVGLLAVVVATVSVDLSRAVSSHGKRVQTLETLQSALTVVTRDLRTADPVVSTTPTACETGRLPAASSTACANELVLDLDRRGARWRITYSLAAGTLTRARQQWTGSTWDTPTTTVLARGLRNGPAPSSPVFALRDNAGQPVSTPAQAGRVNALLVGSSAGRATVPVPVTAEVAVRNRVYRTTE